MCLDTLNPSKMNCARKIAEVSKLVRFVKMTSLTDHTGIVLLINGRKILAVDYVNKEDQLAQRSKPSITKGKVTFGNYNASGLFLKSIMAKLNRKELFDFVKFCMSYKVNDLKSHDCWKFVEDVIQSLARKDKVPKTA